MGSALTKNFEQTTTEYSFFKFDFVSHVCLNNYPFRAFVTMICWTSTEVLLNLVAPLDSAVPSFNFDSASIVFDSLSVSRSLAELYFSHSI